MNSLRGRWVSTFVGLMATSCLITACSPHYQRTPIEQQGRSVNDAPIRSLVEAACGKLMGSAKEVNRDDNTLLVASFADLNALEQSSPLGRLLGQQCSSEIVAKGYQVTELLLAESIYIDPQQGELLLSRDLEQIAAQHDADVVVVGTYTASAETVYVTAKVVRSNDARVLAANNFEIPVNREVISLLGR
ncbi:MAG: hypothetical protein RLZZ602_2215 [Pseudomonadota bacterium]